MSEVVVCTLKPTQELIRIKRPQFLFDDEKPYVSFGKGLTPSKQDKPVALLAIGWGTLIQTCFFDDDLVRKQRQIKLDGCYITP